MDDYSHDDSSDEESSASSMAFPQTGDKWFIELLNGHPNRFYSTFRMSQQIFVDLLKELEECHGLRGSQQTTAREVLAITLYILAQDGSTCEPFQHSTEIISRYFLKGIRALLLLAIKIIKPTDHQFRDIPAEIKFDERYMPFFKDCIGVIDGTHIDARVPIEDRIRYIGRHGTTTQNVMAACDFNMCFTFAIAGWEGSAHDSRILGRALADRNNHFPYPPQGKYYLVDEEYPLRTGFLKPYIDTEYHLVDYAQGSHPIQGRHEYFNKTHSSLRRVIERAFGIWKKKWCVLQSMPQCTFREQRSIVVATMALHNFIRRHPSQTDPEFNACDADENLIYPEAHSSSRRHTEGDVIVELDDDTDLFGEIGVDGMSMVRDSIADELYNACS